MTRKRIILTIGSILLISTVLYLEMSRFAPNRFIVRSRIEESEKIPLDMNNTSIVYMSDVQGDLKNFTKAIRHIQKLKPDLVLFSGALFSDNNTEENKEFILKSLHDINAPLGKFALIATDGNEAQIHALGQSNFAVLNNNSIVITKSDESSIEINFYGDVSYNQFENQEQNFVISILEDAQSIQNIDYESYDLLLSANNTNYINIPFLNPKIKEKDIVVNAGVGSPQFRLFSHPEIVLITLRSLQ